MSCFAFLYTTVFAGFVYLPMRAEDNLAKTTPAKAVSELIYNDRQSPQIVVYKTNVRIASLVQFLNLNTQVAIVNKVDKIPDSCIIITKESTALPLQAQEYDKIGSAEGFTVYAYGEAAREFMKYKRASEVAAAVTEEPAVTSVN